MRILQLGDTHLGAARRAWKPPSGWTRAGDHLAALEAALRPAFREEVDLVVHTGDVFDRSRPPAQAVAEAAALLTALSRRVPVVVLAGNHDRLGLRGHLGESRGGLHIVDGPSQLDVAGLRLGFAPHARQAADWAAAARVACDGGVDALIAHQGVSGARVPGLVFRPGRPAETVDEQHIPAGVRWVLSGHIHPRQAVDCGPSTWVYAGSTERTAFSEAPQVKGVVRWTLGARWSWRFEDLPTRPMVRVQAEADLDGIAPGAFVGIAPRDLRRFAEPARARGGIVALPPARRATDRAQVPLFG